MSQLEGPCIYIYMYAYIYICATKLLRALGLFEKALTEGVSMAWNMPPAPKENFNFMERPT